MIAINTLRPCDLCFAQTNNNNIPRMIHLLHYILYSNLSYNLPNTWMISKIAFLSSHYRFWNIIEFVHVVTLWVIKVPLMKNLQVAFLLASDSFYIQAQVENQFVWTTPDSLDSKLAWKCWDNQTEAVASRNVFFKREYVKLN